MTVLDTHAWIWLLADPGRLPDGARHHIDKEMEDTRRLVVSAISVWEVAMLVARGRLELTLDVESWVRHAEALPFLEFMPVDNAVALRAVSLDGSLHKDPADRIIVATAQTLGACLVSGDRRLQQVAGLTTIWD